MTISPVTAIFRDIEYEKLKIILEAMKNTPIKSIEIAMNSLNANEILKRTIKDFGSDFTIGAGTVINLEILKEVIELGAKFVLSPTTFTKEMFDYAKLNKVITIPGAFSPDEIQKQFMLGADIIKVFPASILGYEYFKSIKSPLSDLKLMAVGGINESNFKKYLENDSDYVGIGSGLYKNISLDDKDKLHEHFLKFGGVND